MQNRLGYVAGGEIKLKGRPIADYGDNLRGKEVGMIFQDPLTSLNPLRKIGDQLAETVLHNLDLSPTEARNKAVAGLREVGIDPDRAPPHQPAAQPPQPRRVPLGVVLDQRGAGPAIINVFP